VKQFRPDNHGLVEENGAPPHFVGSRAEGNTTTAVTVPLNCSLWPADRPPLHFVPSRVLPSLSMYTHTIEGSSTLAKCAGSVAILCRLQRLAVGWVSKELWFDFQQA
jgi:hypothetical protein